MRTVIVAISGNRFIVVFKDGDDISRTDEYETFRDASRGILGWLKN